MSPETDVRYLLDRLEIQDLIAKYGIGQDLHQPDADHDARVVATGNETRRRLLRDLHDGAQQRLVHTIITLKFAKQSSRTAASPLRNWSTRRSSTASGPRPIYAVSFAASFPPRSAAAAFEPASTR